MDNPSEKLDGLRKTTRSVFLSIVYLMVLASGCAPAPTATPTLVSPTFTPLPTATVTPSSTATLTPTITPTPRPRAKDGEIVPHSPPGDAPIGMPEAGSSIFFPESSSGFIFNIESGEFVNIRYSLSLVKGELPDGAVLEVHFQNPLDPATAFTIVVIDLSKDTIYVAGPVTGKPLRVTDFKCQNYWMDIHVYLDAISTQELGIHVQWVNSTFCSPK